ncbi:hypothetical protein J3F83DRAFT_359514 [Trichoderma novae-zelandiae]
MTGIRPMRSAGRTLCCGRLGRIVPLWALRGSLDPSAAHPVRQSDRSSGGPPSRPNPKEPSEAQQPRQSRLRDDACKSITNEQTSLAGNPLGRTRRRNATNRGLERYYYHGALLADQFFLARVWPSTECPGVGRYGARSGNGAMLKGVTRCPDGEPALRTDRRKGTGSSSCITIAIPAATACCPAQDPGQMYLYGFIMPFCHQPLSVVSPTAQQRV